MSFTLNIAAHELREWGEVDCGRIDGATLRAVRLYFAGRTVPEPDVLYVCDSVEAATEACAAGCVVVLVSDEPVEGVAIRVACSEGALVVFDALLSLANRLDEWERAMDSVFYTGGTLQDLVDASEPFLKNNVVILDPALKLLAYTRGIPCDDPITVELIEHGYHTEENIRKFKLHKRFLPWAQSDGFVVNDTHEICKYVTVVKSFAARSSFSLIAVMMCNVVDPEAHLLDLFDMMLQRVGLYAKRDYPDDKPSGNVVDAFLKDLVNGDIDASAIMERSRYAGIPTNARFCLFYLESGGDSVPNPRLLSDVSMAVAPAKAFLVDGAVVVLCFGCQDDSCALHCLGQSCPHRRKTLSDRLNEMLERYDLRCGRSSKFRTLADASTAYGQAKAAYAISQRAVSGRMGEQANSFSRIFSFDAHAIDILVEQLPDRGAHLLDSTYAGSVISEIARCDAEAHTDNYDFLYAYLVHERRTSVVADSLHMHRNNVNYRIGRIEEQFGIDTSDPLLRLDLLMAYRLRAAIIVRNAQ